MTKSCFEMKEPSKKISVITVDYQGHDHWGVLLKTLAAQVERDFELIVVDNDGNYETPKDYFGLEIKIIRSKKNIGYAAGCNLGAKNANGELLVFLNNDVSLSKDWLESLRRNIGLDRKIGAVVSRVLFFPQYVQLLVLSSIFNPRSLGASDDKRNLGIRLRYDPKWSNSTGALKVSGIHGSEWLEGEEWRWTKGKAKMWIPIADSDGTVVRVILDTPVELLGETVQVQLGGQSREIEVDGELHALEFEIRQEDLFDVINSAGSSLDNNGACLERGIYEVDNCQYDVVEELTAFSGCSVMIRKEVFETLGGFDAAFFAYYEDTDLSWRMRKAGWKIVYEPKSVLRHHRSSTSGEQSPFFCFHIYRNMRWNVAKNARLDRALSLLLIELISWTPSTVNTSNEYSALRLKWETIRGMVNYLSRRAIRAIRRKYR